MLIELEASTINPSDLLFIDGNYFKQPLPNPCGFEGVGKVVSAGANSKYLEGKRVCFVKMNGGAWSNFVVVTKDSVFPIDEDVPASSAASALGRMLNKICIK